MNALFGSLTTAGLEEAQDRVGGFTPLASNIYTGTVKLAYAGQSSGGARNITLEIDVGGGKTHRETIYITNKLGENFFLNKQDPTKKVPLPGFTTIDDLCLVATGAPLAEQATEDKVVNIWDNDVKREVPKSVPMLTALLGQSASFAIVNQLVNKSESDGNGGWVTTAAEKNENIIEKVMDTESQKTVGEARNGAEEATYWHSWLAKNENQVRDKRENKGDAAGNAGRPGQAKANGAAPQPNGGQERKKLFGN